MVQHASVVRIAEFSPVEGRRDEVIAELKRIAETIRHAEGSFGAQICSVDDRPHAVVAVSRWRDRSDVEAFFSEHGPRVSDALSPLLSAPAQTTHYTSLSDDG